MLLPACKRKIIFILLLTMNFLLLVSCEKHENFNQGYIEARLAYVSASYSGVLQKLFVKRGDPVSVGQALFVLEQQPESSSYAQAKADLDNAIAAQAEAKADVEFQKKLLARQEILMQKNVIALETLDTFQNKYTNAVAKFNAATAKVNSQKATLEQAGWTRSQKSVVAEQKGRVFDTYFLPSELVPEKTAVLSIIIPNEVRVIFFVKEIQLSSIHVGQVITINCDGYSKRVPAKISFISPRAELTPPVLYTTSERAKFVYRVEADHVSNDVHCFHPGQPVSVFLKKGPHQ